MSWPQNTSGWGNQHRVRSAQRSRRQKSGLSHHHRSGPQRYRLSVYASTRKGLPEVRLLLLQCRNEDPRTSPRALKDSSCNGNQQMQYITLIISGYKSHDHLNRCRNSGMTTPYSLPTSLRDFHLEIFCLSTQRSCDLRK